MKKSATLTPKGVHFAVQSTANLQLGQEYGRVQIDATDQGRDRNAPHLHVRTPRVSSGRGSNPVSAPALNLRRLTLAPGTTPTLIPALARHEAAREPKIAPFEYLIRCLA